MHKDTYFNTIGPLPDFLLNNYLSHRGAFQKYQYLVDLERVGELKKADSRVTFVVAKLQGNDQTVYQTDRPSVVRNIALSTPQSQT